MEKFIEKRNDECFLNSREAADFLEVRLSTLYQLTSQRKIPFYKPNGGIIKFLKSELTEWIKDHRIDSVEELTKKSINRWKEG